MEWVPLMILGVAAASVAGGVSALWMLRHRTQDPDVDELIAEVARIDRTVRRLNMSRVRQAANDVSPPPEFRDIPPAIVGSADPKQALRDRVYGRARIDGGHVPGGSGRVPAVFRVRPQEETGNDAADGAGTSPAVGEPTSREPGAPGRVTSADAAAGILSEADARVPRRNRTSH